MVQLINFGGIKNVNGKTILNGSNSGIDTASLVESLASAKAQPAVNMQTKITANKTKISALNQMNTLMGNLKSSLNALRNPGGLDASQNVFAARSPYVTITNGKTVSDYVGITTANGAPIGKYQIQVTQIATTAKDESVSFADRTSDATGSGKFTAGTYTINGKSFTIASGDNLNNIASAINSISSQSGVTASIVKYSDTDYRISLNGKTTGAANSINLATTSGGGDLTSVFNVKQVAQDSSFNFDGEAVTRSSNTISDLLEGVTFTLYQPTGLVNAQADPVTYTGDTVTLDIDKDDTTIATAVGSFVDAYNALRTFQANQNARDKDGKLLSTSVLGNDPTMTTVLNSLASAFSAQVSEAIPDVYSSTTTQPVPTRLGDLGISFSDIAAVDSITNPDGTVTQGTPKISNMLTLDASKLATALQTNFDAVENIFEFNATSSSSDLSVYKHDNTVMNSDFGIIFKGDPYDGGVAVVQSIDGNSLASPVELNINIVNGQVVISGPAGSPIADLNFIYNGPGAGDHFDKKIALANKDLSVSVSDGKNGDPLATPNYTASISKIFGYDLATPAALVYTANSSSGIIKGTDGSPFAGLQMIYTGEGTQNINISMQQGIADSVYNSLDSMINGSGTNATGLVAAATNGLTDSDTKLQTSIDRINDQVTTYRTQLLTKFSQLEAAIGSANQLLTLLSAQSDARNNSN